MKVPIITTDVGIAQELKTYNSEYVKILSSSTFDEVRQSIEQVTMVNKIENRLVSSDKLYEHEIEAVFRKLINYLTSLIKSYDKKD